MKIRNERRNIIINLTEIKRFIRTYYEHLYRNKLENLEEMNKCWERYKLPNLNQGEIENLNIPIINKDIELIADNSSQKKAPDHMVSLVNSTILLKN